MQKFYTAFILLMTISCSAPDQTAPKSAIDIAAELEAIEATRSNFATALKEGRFKDTGKYVTGDISTVIPASKGWLEMYALGKERGRVPYDSIIMTPIETYIMNDSMAYDFGTSQVYYTNEEGDVVELQDTFLAILKKENGVWKLHREVASGNPVR